VRQRPSGSEAGSSGAKRQKKRIPFQTLTFHFLTTTYAVNSPPYRYGKTKLSFRLYLICLVLCLSFFVIDLMVSIDFVLRNCAQNSCKSLNKQSSGVQERINPFHINSYGENSFGLRTTFRNELSS